MNLGKLPASPAKFGLGHEAQFPPPEPSARYRFGQATFAGRVATSETL